MTPEERYAQRRFLTADEDEVQAWRQLGLAYGKIIDLLKDEFWQTQEHVDDDASTIDAPEVMLDWSDEGSDMVPAG